MFRVAASRTIFVASSIVLSAGIHVAATKINSSNVNKPNQRRGLIRKI